MSFGLSCPVSSCTRPGHPTPPIAKTVPQYHNVNQPVKVCFGASYFLCFLGQVTFAPLEGGGGGYKREGVQARELGPTNNAKQATSPAKAVRSHIFGKAHSSCLAFVHCKMTKPTVLHTPCTTKTLRRSIRTARAQWSQWLRGHFNTFRGRGQSYADTCQCPHAPPPPSDQLPFCARRCSSRTPTHASPSHGSPIPKDRRKLVGWLGKISDS